MLTSEARGRLDPVVGALAPPTQAAPIQPSSAQKLAEANEAKKGPA